MHVPNAMHIAHKEPWHLLSAGGVQHQNTEFEQLVGILALHHSTFSFLLILHKVQVRTCICCGHDFVLWLVPRSQSLKIRKLIMEALLDLLRILALMKITHHTVEYTRYTVILQLT